MTMDYLKELWRSVFPYVSGAGAYLWASAKALLKTTAVWGAVAALFLGTYWLAYMHGAAGKRTMREEVSASERARQAANDRSAFLASANREALIEIKKLKGEIEAMKEKPPQTTKSAAVAPVRKRQVPKAVKSTPAAGDASQWLPPWAR